MCIRDRFGNVFTAPADPERAGYTFDGWYAAGADVPFDFVNTKAAENLTLTAHWKLLAPEVGITVENTEPHIGDEVVLTANASHKAADVKYTYQWYKDCLLYTSILWQSISIRMKTVCGSPFWMRCPIGGYCGDTGR